MSRIKKILRLYSLPMYILVRPIDGFYEMKYGKKGTMRLALFNFFMVCVSVSFMNQYASIVVNQTHPLSNNSIRDFGILVTSLILFSVGNWSITSLTDGEGKFSEIVMALCYAMTPVVLTFIPATILSNFLALEESAFYTILVSFSVVYFVLLAFVGMIVVHNYTVVKALLTVLFTFIAMLIIVFLATLLFTLLQQLYSFVMSVYTEIAFRA